MSFTDSFRSVPYLPANDQSVPIEIQSNTLNRPIPSSVSTVAINSGSGDQTSGGFSTIMIPTGMSTGAIKPSSAYLRFDFAAVISGTGTHSFKLPAGSAASCIRQITVSIGGQTLEQINQYGVYHNQLLLHATNRNYLEGDAAIQEGAGLVAVTRASGTAYTFCVPLALGLFNSSRAVPLYLMNGSPIQVQVDWALPSECVRASGTETITSTTVSNVQFVYDSVSLDDSFKQAVKMRMADAQNPALYQLEYDTVLANRTANAQNINLNLGVNSSSVKSLLYSVVNDGADANTARKFTYGLTATGAAESYLYLDGRQVNNIRIDKPEVAFVETQKSLGLAFSPELSYGASAVNTAVEFPTSRTTYITDYFLGGINTTRFNSQGNAMVGSPCTQMQIVRTANQAVVAGSNLYYFIVHSVIIAIDAMGNVTLVR